MILGKFRYPGKYKAFGQCGESLKRARQYREHPKICTTELSKAKEYLASIDYADHKDADWHKKVQKKLEKLSSDSTLSEFYDCGSCLTLLMISY